MFIMKIAEDLKKAFREEGIKIRAVYNPVIKPNCRYEALMVIREGSSIGVNVNMDYYASLYDQGESYDEVLKKVFTFTKDALKESPEVDAKDLLCYDKMKEKLILHLMNREKNEELLKEVPHILIADLAVAFRFLIGGHATALVTNSLLKSFGITKEQLIEDAMEYAPKNKRARISTMEEIIGEMMGISEEEVSKTELPMVVVSGEDSTLGAAVIAYPGVLEEVARYFAGDYFLLPSSIHEVICIPAAEVTSPKDFLSMVQQVNRSEVLPEDFLSDNLYRYNAKKSELTVWK